MTSHVILTIPVSPHQALMTSHVIPVSPHPITSLVLGLLWLSVQPDPSEECCDAETLTDSSQGKDVAADPIIVVDDAVLVGPIAPFLPLLTGQVKQLPHGHRTWYSAQ